MRIFAPLVLGLALAMLTACGGGAGNPVSSASNQDSISGPSTIDEGTSAGYSVQRVAAAPASYVWSARPPDAGQFEITDQPGTTFIASSVDTDTDVELRVLITPQHGTPSVSSLTVIIKDKAEAPNDGPEPPTAQEPQIQPPIAIAYASSNRVNKGQLVSFNASNSYDPDCAGDLALYEWDWENDGIYDASGRVLSHLFNEHGIYPVMLRVTDHQGDTALLDEPIAIIVDPGTTITWGGAGADIGNQCVVGESGNIYVAGMFTGTVDLDPSYFVEEHTPKGTSGAFLAKYNPDLHLLWISTWGSGDSDTANDIAVQDGFVYVTGTGFVRKFTDSGDLVWANDLGKTGEAVVVDPSVGVYVAGHYPFVLTLEPDCYLAAFDLDGNPRWEKTWGGPYDDRVYDMIVNSNGNVYVTGHVMGDVDMDPSQDGEYLVQYYRSSFVSIFDPYGNFGGCYTWDAEDAFGMDIDSSGSIFVTGKFVSSIYVQNTLEGNYYESGNEGSYLLRLDCNLVVAWARAWTEYSPPYSGNYKLDPGYDVDVTDSGDVVVVGSFVPPFDFDPSDDEDVVDSGGAYLTRFDIDGNYHGVRTWGDFCPNDGYDNAYSVTIDAAGNAFVTGDFGNICNFDPPGEEFEISSGYNDAYLMKFPSGTY
jgi:hypothetical protein